MLSTIFVLLVPAVAAAPATFPRNLASDTVPVPYDPARRHGSGSTGGGRTVFLNFDGQVLSCGDDDSRQNKARLACPPESLTDTPPFSAAGYGCGSAAACKETIRGTLTALWSDWNIRFVTERPKEGSYEMAMVGGSRGGAILGIAPLDCMNDNANTVSFSFSNDMAGLPCPEEVLATTISQELAHALGLCHNDQEDGIMFPSVTGCAQSWVCGAQVDACGCPGSSAYCPNDYLLELLGPAPPDTVAPSVQIISPLSGLRVPTGFGVRAIVRDDRTLQTVTLEVNTTRVHETEPDVSGLYDWNMPTLPGGHARVCVLGRDTAGNEGADCINLTIDPGAGCTPGDCCCGERCCEQFEACDCAGRLADGEDCELDQDCRGALCEDDPWDAQTGQRCTESCAEDAECPPGLACHVGARTGRGECWSYVAPDGVGQPCHADLDCPGSLSCAFPEGCAEQPPPGGVGDGGTCLGKGFCSRPCGDPGMMSCPERYACAEVDGTRACRFVGVRAQVGGGCALAGPVAPSGWLALLGLAALACRGLARLERTRRGSAR